MDRYAWTSDDNGSGKGTVFVMGNMPPNCKLLPDPPEPSIGADFQLRYWFDEPADAWTIKPDALPHQRPADFYAWDWSERYDVDPFDPLRNSWILKPDAQPVTKPEE